MEFKELIRRRYSVRSYLPAPVSEEALERILEAGRLAPTAANRQPFRIVVLDARGRPEGLGRVYARPWFLQAPLVICVCGVPEEAWVRKDGRSHLDVDAAIVMDHIILAATEEGLGTCWVCAFDEAKAKAILGVPPEARVVAMVTLGYSDGSPPRPFARKPLADLVHWERW